MAQPPGFVDQDKPFFVCKLHKAIYRLKQAPWAWYYELHHFLLAFRFRNSHCDTSLFIFHRAPHVLYLLVYVDDIIVTGSNDAVLSQFVSSLAKRFFLKDLGDLSYFLGVDIISHKHGLLLS
jgi:histone deacetylase 1/2